MVKIGTTPFCHRTTFYLLTVTKSLEIGYGKSGNKLYVIVWTKNGNLKFVIPYHNDLKHGTTIFYGPQGAIEKAHHYENNEFVFESHSPFVKEVPNKSGLEQPATPSTSP
jgi:antitoxin component YwqK of YwqJK toxin-antitoxin module